MAPAEARRTNTFEEAVGAGPPACSMAARIVRPANGSDVGLVTSPAIVTRPGASADGGGVDGVTTRASPSDISNQSCARCSSIDRRLTCTITTLAGPGGGGV